MQVLLRWRDYSFRKSNSWLENLFYKWQNTMLSEVKTGLIIQRNWYKVVGVAPTAGVWRYARTFTDFLTEQIDSCVVPTAILPFTWRTCQAYNQRYNYSSLINIAICHITFIEHILYIIFLFFYWKQSSFMWWIHLKIHILNITYIHRWHCAGCN